SIPGSRCAPLKLEQYNYRTLAQAALSEEALLDPLPSTRLNQKALAPCQWQFGVPDSSHRDATPTVTVGEYWPGLQWLGTSRRRRVRMRKRMTASTTRPCPHPPAASPSRNPAPADCAAVYTRPSMTGYGHGSAAQSAMRRA